MISNEWVCRLIQKELTDIVIALDRRNVDEVAKKLTDTLTRRSLTVVPTYLSDEMYNAQKTLLNTLTYSEASELYKSAVADFSNKKSAEKKEEWPGGFW